MVTDVAGFAASVWHRGVPVVHVATTLLGMVDAAIGGKTGVNLPEGKNLVGAFWQPAGVVCDLDALVTLPDRERRSGDGEMAKYHFLTGDDLDAMTLTDRVARCVEIKAEVVASDEREGGRRALLNYGHTLAHALEIATEHRLTHGEAVGVGLDLRRRAGPPPRTASTRPGSRSTARSSGSSTGCRRRCRTWLSTDDLVTLMGRDKKALTRRVDVRARRRRRRRGRGGRAGGGGACRVRGRPGVMPDVRTERLLLRALDGRRPRRLRRDQRRSAGDGVRSDRCSPGPRRTSTSTTSWPIGPSTATASGASTSTARASASPRDSSTPGFMPGVEVGWRLASAHWGRGYAPEAARAALAFGFDVVGLTEIVSFTDGPQRQVTPGHGEARHDPRPRCRLRSPAGAARAAPPRAVPVGSSGLSSTSSSCDASVFG